MLFAEFRTRFIVQQNLLVSFFSWEGEEICPKHE